MAFAELQLLALKDQSKAMSGRNLVAVPLLVILCYTCWSELSLGRGRIGICSSGMESQFLAAVARPLASFVMVPLMFFNGWALGQGNAHISKAAGSPVFVMAAFSICPSIAIWFWSIDVSTSMHVTHHVSARHASTTAFAASLLAFACGCALCDLLATLPGRVRFWRERLLVRCASMDRTPDTFCVYCYEQEKAYAFMPCGHRSVCGGCSERICGAVRGGELCRCLVCRAIIVGAMRVYDA